MILNVVNEIAANGVLSGVVYAQAVAVKETGPDLKSALDALVGDKAQTEFAAETKDAVRNLLKTGGFKPSGRNKPASEYLAQAAREGRFPYINNLVDINNLISLETGLPISLLDASAIGGTLKIRYGRPGERYVFNASGQDIDLAGLVCACSGERDEPLGNPVKDSMAGKIKDKTTSVVGVIYSPADAHWRSVTERAVAQFAHWLKLEGGATQVDSFVV